MKSVMQDFFRTRITKGNNNQVFYEIKFFFKLSQ